MSKFQIRVIAIGSNEAPLVRTIRLVTDLGAFDSAVVFAYLGNHAPCILVAGVNGEVAEHLLFRNSLSKPQAIEG
jgi:hypothetical protein